MEYEMHPIFKSYREYVAQCINNEAEVPTLTEFSESKEPFKFGESELQEVDDTWIDPAGGVHSPNEEDPVKQYE